MTWTYSLANVGSSSLSWIRLRIGDNSSAFPLMQDEEITAVLADVGSDQTRAAARCCRAIAGQFARRVDKTAGKLRMNAGQAMTQYLDMAAQLETEADLRVTPYAGGISISDKQSQLADGDRVLPQFEIGETDLPPSGSPWASSTELTGWP